MSLVLIVLVLRKVDWPSLTAVLARLQPGWAIAGSLSTFLLLAGLAVRWRIFLREQNIFLPNRTILALIWSGQFFNSILPGSTGGDVFKIFQVCRLVPTRKAAAAATVVADRLAALAALLVFAAIAFVLEPAPLRFLLGDGVSVNELVLWALPLSLVAAAAAYWAFRKFRSAALVQRVFRTLAAVRGTLAFKPPLALAVLLAFAVHAINFTIVYLFARALHIEIGYGQILLMMPVVLFLLLLPVTINGHGLRELLLIGYFQHFGVGLTIGTAAGLQEIVVALSVVLVANDLLWSLPGGLLYFQRKRSAIYTAT